jgi:glycosyltransferase involved in cell wall biosynthesis
MNKTIIHISEVDITPEGGMGRVEYYWKKAFEKRGFNFIHIGPKEVGEVFHKGLFPYKAYSYFKGLNIKPSAFIVHEPIAGLFVKRGIPCFVESHGIERRYWEASSNNLVKSEKTSLRTKLFFPLWRLYNCDKGLKNAEKLLLINSDDRDFAVNSYSRNEKDIFLFKNGIIPVQLNNKPLNIANFVVLFNGSWINRKGKLTLVEAAKSLCAKGLKIHYLLIGTGSNKESIMLDWPKELWSYVTIIPNFKEYEEIGFLNISSLFVLPSYHEGQPLSLLQAMATGKCCITTNCCGQKDLITDKITGLLFNPGNHEQLSNLIENCYNNPILMQTIGENAMKYISAYTWEKVSLDLVDYVTRNL